MISAETELEGDSPPGAHLVHDRWILHGIEEANEIVDYPIRSTGRGCVSGVIDSGTSYCLGTYRAGVNWATALRCDS